MISLQQSLLIAGFIFCVASCSVDDPRAPSETYQYQIPLAKNDGWAVDSLAEVNINESLLIDMMDAIQQENYTQIDSVVIARAGKLVFDELIRTKLDEVDGYVQNRNLEVHSVQSVSKSVASALMGIAIEQGVIQSVDNRIWDYLPEYLDALNWDENKNEITIHDLLTMRHGFEYDEWTYPYSDNRNSLGLIYQTCVDLVRCTLNLPMQSEPGTEYTYSTAVSIVIGAIIENAAGEQLENFADMYLFDPLGIESDLWDFTAFGRANTGGGLFLSSRDMAKFGQLFLSNGEWEGATVISPMWINQSTNSIVDIRDLGSFREGYGFQWWIRNFQVSSQTIELYHAEGNGGQFIYVIPSLDTVVVFTGANYNRIEMRQPEDLMKRFILPAIH